MKIDIKPTIAILALAALLGINPASGADESAAVTTKPVKPSAGSHGNLAEQATNPVAPLIKLQLQNYFIFDSIDADGYANQLIVQPVVPVAAMGPLPRAIWRPTIPIVSSADFNPGPDGTTGLGDIASIYVFNFDQEWGITGIGPSMSFPTATDARLGARKWTAGPAVFALYTKIPKVQLGGLLFNDWSFAGVGANDVNKLSLQVVANFHFADGWYAGWGDQALNYNWETNKAYIPLSARLGHVGSIGKQPVNIFGQVAYNVGDDQPGQDQWGFKLNVTLLFPE
jgi:hypothetical protein